MLEKPQELLGIAVRAAQRARHWTESANAESLVAMISNAINKQGQGMEGA